MKIWLYSIVRDEAVIMPYLLRHYETFCDRMVFYDDQSRDGTRQMIVAHPKATLHDWPGTHGIVDDEFLEFAHETWKEARGHADWVIWIDADEFLYHPQTVPLLEGYLRDGVEVPQVQGFTMLSHSLPSTKGQIYDEIRTGIPDECWSKHVIFRGQIAWNVGRHSINLDKCNPKFSPTAELKLLHYRCLGLDHLKARHARNWARVPEHCRNRNYGNNTMPGWEGHHGAKWFEALLSRPLKAVL